MIRTRELRDVSPFFCKKQKTAPTAQISQWFDHRPTYSPLICWRLSSETYIRIWRFGTRLKLWVPIVHHSMTAQLVVLSAEQKNNWLSLLPHPSLLHLRVILSMLNTPKRVAILIPFQHNDMSSWSVDDTVRANAIQCFWPMPVHTRTERAFFHFLQKTPHTAGSTLFGNYRDSSSLVLKCCSRWRAGK